MNEEQKEKVTDAFRQGMKDGYESSKDRNLRWWERILWVLLAGVAAAAGAWLTACSASYSQTAGGNIRASVTLVPLEQGK